MKKFYLALVAVVLTASAFAQPCSKLFFSEYIEGTGSNKALEIYNPTSLPVNLSGYKILSYANGAATATTYNMSGIIAAGDVYVIANTACDTQTMRPFADTLTGSQAVNFNGNDVIALLNGTDTLDRIGIVGDTANIAFDTTTGKDHSYVRLPDVLEGTKNWAVGKLQWITYPVNSSHLGSHTANSCAAITDTLVVFAPTAASVSENAGTYNVTLFLNAISSSTNFSVDVALTGGSGSAADINNYTTQTVTFNAGSASNTLALTITDDLLQEASETLVFTLSNPTNGLLLGNDSVFTLTIGASDAPVQTVVISQLTSVDTSFQPDSLGKVVLTSGTVYGINTSAFGVQFTIHDATDGIQVVSFANSFGYTVTEGDSVAVSGTVEFFRGMTQLGSIDTIFKIGTGTLASPLLTPDLDETTESELVRLNNVHLVTPTQWDTTGNSGGFSCDITDGVGSWTLRIDDQTDIFKNNQPAPPANFNVIGLGGQFDNSAPYNSGYQILPRYHQDIILISGVNDVAAEAVRIYPNPNNGLFTIQMNNSANTEVKLFDLAGKLVYSTNSLTVQAQNLQAGMYVVEVLHAGNISRSKVTIAQ